jgi:aldehyde:ferredoxin oxidoreductase
MGAKRLKCVAALGSTAVPVADEEGVRDLTRWMVQHWRDRSLRMHELGTNGGLLGLNVTGRLPTRNFQDGQFEGAEQISGETMRDTILVDRGSCFACPIRCKRVVKVDDGRYTVDPEYGGPEYETTGAFGSNCGVDDLPAIAKANELCNANSLDTIATGATVAFAMECYEKGLLTAEETGGLELNFGNAEAMVELTRMICEREGLGDLLAEGPTRAAAAIGKGAEAFVLDVKSQPFPMHECRARHGQALGFALSPTGADHIHNMWDDSLANDPLGESWQSLGIYVPVPTTELDAHKVRAYKVTADWRWFRNSVGCCGFLPWSQDQYIQIVRAVTGWETNLYEALQWGERGITLARVFNMREGLSRADDVLPPRTRVPHVSGSLNEVPIDPEVLDEAVGLYYGMMGWDSATGAPTPAKLHELDVAWAGEGARAIR